MPNVGSKLFHFEDVKIRRPGITRFSNAKEISQYSKFAENFHDTAGTNSFAPAKPLAVFRIKYR